MSQSTETPQLPDEDRLSPDDALPPVEPPNAGFIVKLFVVPAAVVTSTLLIVLLFNWLVHMDANPQDDLAAVERGDANAWQRINDIVHELKRDAALRNDPKFAGRLEALLAERIEEPPPAGETDEAKSEVWMRIFLCKSLGEFEIPDGMPVLLEAARLQRNQNERDVQLAALESVALLVSNLRRRDPSYRNAAALDVLLSAAADRDRVVRSRAAFALGVLGGDEARAQLVKMLNEGFPDARFNAATGLARWGDEACVDVLAEMLDPEETAGMDVEEELSSKDAKKWLIQFNGMRAAEELADRNDRADLEPLVEPLEKLQRQPDLPAKVGLEAKKLQELLRRRGQKQAG